MSKNTGIPIPSLAVVLHGAVKNAKSGLDARTIADLVGKPYATLMGELFRQEVDANVNASAKPTYGPGPRGPRFNCNVRIGSTWVRASGSLKAVMAWIRLALRRHNASGRAISRKEGAT